MTASSPSYVATDATFRDQPLQTDAPGLPTGFFDRFVFNAHPEVLSDGAISPSLILGLGIYPGKDVIDGFVVLSDDTEQRNLRFASTLSVTGAAACGPLRYDVVEPHRQWRLQLADNPIDVEFDLLWQARTPAWFGEINVANPSSTIQTAFEHLFQSGRYRGALTVDGQRHRVDGWYGQRDRSRGVRTMAGGQGLHIWFQAQFREFSIGFLLVETRTWERVLLVGGVMFERGDVDPIVDVRHDLDFDESRDLRSGLVDVVTASGRRLVVSADASARGGFMAGGGYGGHHGLDLGVDHVEHDRYRLDGSVTPLSLDSSLVDRLCAFTCDGEPGSGIFEFALTRSRSFAYRPSPGL